MMTSPFKNITQQFIVFCGVGGINTVLSLLIILVLSEFLDFYYVLANIIGYAAGLISGFIMHKNITFRASHSSKSSQKQFSSFLIVFAVGYVAQLVVLMLLVEQIALPNMPSQIISWCAYVVLSFVGNKYFTFHGDQHE